MAFGKLSFPSFLLAVVVLVACESKAPERTGADSVQLMADLHCQAVEFRKARFELADKMRFMEDTLMRTSTPDSVKERLTRELEELTPYKDSIVTGGLELAKVIKSKLDSLIEIEFTEQEQRKNFDAQLTTELEKRGCQ